MTRSSPPNGTHGRATSPTCAHDPTTPNSRWGATVCSTETDDGIELRVLPVGLAVAIDVALVERSRHTGTEAGGRHHADHVRWRRRRPPGGAPSSPRWR